MVQGQCGVHEILSPHPMASSFPNESGANWTTAKVSFGGPFLVLFLELSNLVVDSNLAGDIPPTMPRNWHYHVQVYVETSQEGSSGDGVEITNRRFTNIRRSPGQEPPGLGSALELQNIGTAPV